MKHFLFAFLFVCVLTVGAEENGKAVSAKENLFRKKTEQVHKAGERMVKTVDGIEYAFRWCPAGTFMMGSPTSESDRDNDETQHKVTLTKGFWMLDPGQPRRQLEQPRQ